MPKSVSFRTVPFLLLTALFFVGCSTPNARKEPESHRLMLMTYNIRIGKGGGPWNDDPQKIDLEPVARLIESWRPDIIGLQEVDRFRRRSAMMNQPEWLARRLSMNVGFQPAFSVPASSGTNEDYGIALLTRFPIRHHERHLLFKPDYSRSHPNYPDYYSEQRALLHGEIDIGGHRVHVFVTHLGLTPDQRVRQVAEIAEILARQPGPKIVFGDFNAPPEGPAMKPLAALTDVLTAVGTPRERRNSFPAGAAPAKPIDYIFVSSEFKVLRANVVLDTSLASDHNPVIAEVEFRPVTPAARPNPEHR